MPNNKETKPEGDTPDNQKYAEVPDFVKSYPKPEPPRLKKKDIFELEEYKDIDKRAKEVPEDKTDTFPTLVTNLTRGLNTDVQKVRAIFSWIATQEIVKGDFKNVTGRITPKGYLKQIQDDISEYSSLFTILCREADIPCVKLSGTVTSENIDTKFVSCWNAVYVGGGWRFVQTSFAFCVIKGRKSGGWLKVEADGEKVREESAETEGVRVNSKQEFYFLTDPEDFIHFCRPYDEKWQLLRSPLSQERFENFPYIRPAFVESGFNFRKGQTRSVADKDGECWVVLQARDSWNGLLSYELFYKQESSRVFPDSQGADKYVTMTNKNHHGEIKFRIKFPIEGTYKLSIYKRTQMTVSWLCDFRLECLEAKVECEPLPVNPEIGWGPGNASRKIGIHSPSHNEGIIESNPDTNLSVSFRTKAKLNINAKLKHNHIPDNELKPHVKTTVKNNSVSVQVNPPEPGEYALIIDAIKDKSSKESGIQKNVLNYIITHGNDTKKPRKSYENATEKQVRTKLRNATKEKNREEIIKTIERFQKLKMENKGHLTKAQSTLEIMDVREVIRFAKMKNRVDELEKAIQRARDSPEASKLKKDIEDAERARDALVYTSTTPRPVSAVNKATLTELRTIKRLTTTLRDVLTATFLLLGEKSFNLQDQAYVMMLMKKTGRESLQYRLDNCDPTQIDQNTQADAKRLLDPHNAVQVTRACPAVGKVFLSALTILRECEQPASLTPSPSFHNESETEASV